MLAGDAFFDPDQVNHWHIDGILVLDHCTAFLFVPAAWPAWKEYSPMHRSIPGRARALLPSFHLLIG